MRIRLITYNIHKGIGGIDRRYQPQRVGATIAHYNQVGVGQINEAPRPWQHAGGGPSRRSGPKG